MGDQGAGGGDEVAEVGAVGRLGLGCADAEEVQFRAGRVGEVGREGEPSGGAAVREQLVQARLKEGRGSAAEVLHFGGVDVDPHHGVSHRGQGGGVHGAEVAATDHGDFHRVAPCGVVDSGVRPARSPAASEITAL